MSDRAFPPSYFGSQKTKNEVEDRKAKHYDNLKKSGELANIVELIHGLHK